ncbi:hypothetical protein RIF29_24737 [Crotalaria pallida]|uniref:Uncharacterized protein n=1 Tax=Crotalaria pallida TaxID=3830 RepID=A0AAN9EL00_CROPI
MYDGLSTPRRSSKKSKKEEKIDEEIEPLFNDTSPYLKPSRSQALKLVKSHSLKVTNIPSDFRTCFPLTGRMGLSKSDEELALYVFGDQLPKTEVLFKAGDVKLTREYIINNLVPGRPINPAIIDLMALKAKYNTQQLYRKTCCSLPSSFADDVLVDMISIKEIHAKYLEYMPHILNDLNYMYDDGSE